MPMIIFRYDSENCMTPHFQERNTHKLYLHFNTQIYDGPNAASKLLGTYCNAEQLIQMESTSHVVFIRLITDVNNQGRGFELKFNASKKHSNIFQFEIVSEMMTRILDCQRQIRDLQGAIGKLNELKSLLAIFSNFYI